MTNIELYIDNQLCDIQNPNNLGVRLNRQFLNPAELATKDSQYSYSITIPSTNTNDAIFRYSAVEEVKNKFNHNYLAKLYVDSILVFDGRFKLNEIDSQGNYKGNLLVPAPKTVKDIFGEKRMNQIGKWELTVPVSDTKDKQGNEKLMGFAEMLNHFNEQPGTPPCFFPTVLYGLLPKVPKDSEGNYSPKDVWDEHVRLGVEDFPPSINCLETIRHIFETAEFKEAKAGDNKFLEISGSAFDDERLKNLYMSYSNPTDYQQQWNWAHLGKLEIEGNWYAAIDKGEGLDNTFSSDGGLATMENRMFKSTGKSYSRDGKNENETHFCAVNLLSASNSEVTIKKDFGYNTYQYKSINNEVVTKHTNIRVPLSGMYKITLSGSVELMATNNQRVLGPLLNQKIQYYNSSSYQQNEIAYVYANMNNQTDNYFHNLRSELKLIRIRAGDELDMTEQGIDGLFFRDNFKQLDDRNNAQREDNNFQKFDTYPKYFPKEDSVLWVDPYQNRNFVCGFHFGKNNQFTNPVDNRYTDKNALPCYRMAAKSGISWSTENDDVNYCIANSESYYTYKRISNEELINEEEKIDQEEQQEEEGVKTDPKYLGYKDEGMLKMELADIDEREYVKFERNEEKPENQIADGNVSVVMWLDKGDQLALLDLTDCATNITKFIWNNGKTTTYSRRRQEGFCVAHRTTFNLSIEPYKKTTDFAKIKMDGTGVETMKWADNDSDYTKNNINLADFLPSDVKVDEWLTQFCKAFNLDLVQPEAGKFQLNLKRGAKDNVGASVLDLSDKLNIVQRTNQPLGLPSEIELTFKINEEEEGYDQESIKYLAGNTLAIDEGSGKLLTGSIDGKPIKETLAFSYNWYKPITCSTYKGGGSSQIEFPIISNKEVWTDNIRDYAEMMKKTYTNYAQRFWYRNPTAHNLGAIWKNRYFEDINENGQQSQDTFTDKNTPFYAYSVSNEYASLDTSQRLILNYHNKPITILQSYFVPLVTEDSNYTQVECYLTPDEYEELSAGRMVFVNSDLYYVASLSGYDPLGRNKTQLKLIRKTL